MSGFEAVIEGAAGLEGQKSWSLSGTLPLPLNRCSVESTVEQDLQNALSKTANFVKDFG